MLVLWVLVFGWLAAPAVGLRDSGELGTAGAVLGVPHPTGFPVDVVLLRAFSYLPIGTMAFRQNLGVALLAAVALALLADCAARLTARVSGQAPGPRWLAALVASGCLASWGTFLTSALTVEVYITALLAVVAAANASLRGHRLIGTLFALTGLSLGMHITAPMYCGGLLLAVLTAQPPADRLRVVALWAPATIVGALVLTYLPLASLRDPPLDWGNPETLAALVHHLTAGRIRSAFAHEMLAGDGAPTLRLGAQIGEFGLALLLVAPGLWAALRACRGTALMIVALGVLDLAYAVRINPMGIVDRQVGHVLGASLCVLAGVGAGVLCAQVRGRGLRTLVGVGLFGVPGMALAGAPLSYASTGFAADELFGSGGSLASLPPRSVLVCWSDSQCAAGLFARHAEGARPDVAVVPAQHLWDEQYLRHLRDMELSQAPLSSSDRGHRQAAFGVVVELARPSAPRPVFWESPAPLRLAGETGALQAAVHVPYFRVPEATAPATNRGIDAWLSSLEVALKAREIEHTPSGDQAREVWARALRLAGEEALGLGSPQHALPLLTRAVELYDRDPSAWVALGVAHAAAGDAVAALSATHQALSLRRDHATAWVNLVRFLLGAGRMTEARKAYGTARDLGVTDSRLDAMAADLSE